MTYLGELEWLPSIHFDVIDLSNILCVSLMVCVQIGWARALKSVPRLYLLRFLPSSTSFYGLMIEILLVTLCCLILMIYTRALMYP